MDNKKFTEFLIKQITFYRRLCMILCFIMISLFFTAIHIDKKKVVMEGKCEVVVSTCNETIKQLGNDLETCKQSFKEDNDDLEYEIREKGEKYVIVSEDFVGYNYMDGILNSDASIYVLCR